MTELAQPRHVDPADIESFERNGFVHLKDVLTPETIAEFKPAVVDTLLAQTDLHKIPLEERTTYQRAFLQVTNLWHHDTKVQEFAFSRRLAGIAADLLGVNRVRLYADQGLFKESGGGITPWHADQYYWPLSNDRAVTAWIPLQAVPPEMGPLTFAAGSHRTDLGRDVGISDESERYVSEQIASGGFEVIDEPFDLGDVSFHLGWTFHRAQPNRTDSIRNVMTIIYVDADVRITSPKTREQVHSVEKVMGGAPVGGTLLNALNPVVFDRDDPSGERRIEPQNQGCA